MDSLKLPEYRHVILNPLPIYGLAVAWVALVAAVITRNRVARAIGLSLVIVTSLSILPVINTGEDSYKRVYAMTYQDGQHGWRFTNTALNEPPLAQNALLQRVGRRIASVVELPGAQWEFVLFENPRTPNAFCLPGGKVGVYTGILPITQDADGLATVIGHEVAHAVARHGAERMSEALLIQLGGQVLAVALGTRGALTRQVALQAYGIGAEVGRALPHSRSQELEADQLGLLYMARAGYDPRKAVAFWRRFQAYNQERGGSRVEFLSTHPLDDRRIAHIEAYLPQALRAYRGAEGSEP